MTYKNILISDKIEWSHVGIIIYAIVLMIALIGSGVVVAKRRTFKYTGVLQSAFVTLYVLTTIWVALGSSPSKIPQFCIYELNILVQNRILTQEFFPSQKSRLGCISTYMDFVRKTERS